MSAKLRGPRHRQERRHFRRGTWFRWKTDQLQTKVQQVTNGIKEFSEAVNRLAAKVPDDTPLIKAEGEYSCKTCGATGDNPCVTKSGKIATKEHSGRTVL